MQMPRHSDGAFTLGPGVSVGAGVVGVNPIVGLGRSCGGRGARSSELRKMGGAVCLDMAAVPVGSDQFVELVDEVTLGDLGAGVAGFV